MAQRCLWSVFFFFLKTDHRLGKMWLKKKEKMKPSRVPASTFLLTLHIITLSLCAAAALRKSTSQIWLQPLPPWKSCNAVQGGWDMPSFWPYILFILIQLSHKMVCTEAQIWLNLLHPASLRRSMLMCCTPASMIQRREEVRAITSYMVFPLPVKKKRRSASCYCNLSDGLTCPTVPHSRY